MFPFLEVEGKVIYDSQAIATYFARVGGAEHLLGTSTLAASQVDQWFAFVNTSVWGSVKTAAGQVFGFKPHCAVTFDAAVKTLKEKAKTVEEHLKGKHWLVGDSLTLADVSLFCSFIVPFQTLFDASFVKTVPNFTAWFKKIASLPSVVGRVGYVKVATVVPKFKEGVPTWTAPAPAKEAAKPAPTAAAAEEEEDELDLFGSEDEETVAAAAAVKAKAAEAKADAKKAGPIAKSLIVYDVKPWGEETNLDDLASKILEISMDGLWWKTEYKLEPVAYGIKKIVIGCTIEDEKVSSDTLEELISAFEDDV